MMLGADPEMFLEKEGKVVSAIGKIGGTKQHPIPIKELGKGFALQEDNVLLEYNIPPAKDVYDFVEFHNVMQAEIDKRISPMGLKRRLTASEIMPEEELDNPQALVFGCEPDFNAWTLSWNNRPCAEDPRLRSAGGHIHVGQKMTKTEKIRLVRYLDALLGCASVIYDPDNRRRQLYGKAGSFRWKPYGLEYRVLSNFWLTKTKYQDGIFRAVTRALAWVESGKNLKEEVYPTVLKAINEGDKDAAHTVIKTYGDYFA